MEILIILKEVSSVFEKCQFLVKKIFYAKSVSFWANDWNSKFIDKIISCKLWGKVTSVSVNINFGAKMSILCKKKWNFGRNVDWKLLSFCKICLYLEKCDFLCEGLYTSTKFQILIKNFSFLGYVNLCMC